MISDIITDIFKRFGQEIIKVLVVIIAVICLVAYVKSCAPWSYKKKLERAVATQNETIKELVVHNQEETKAVTNEREERKETTERLVTHLDTKQKDAVEFKEIITDLHKQYKPPTRKPQVKKPVVKQPSESPEVVAEDVDRDAMEALRTQYNLRVSQQAIQRAYEKALQMSQPQT